MCVHIHIRGRRCVRLCRHAKKRLGALKEVLATKEPVFLVGSDTTIALDGIHEEMAYLIENIKGNANYGDEMEQAVTAFFA